MALDTKQGASSYVFDRMANVAPMTYCPECKRRGVNTPLYRSTSTAIHDKGDNCGITWFKDGSGYLVECLRGGCSYSEMFVLKA